ncbi:MAG: hypothetical protein JJU16_00890 [Alkalibacterium sp.]|nr:hypothetical protein [Alkalibacterium sp.]
MKKYSSKTLLFVLSLLVTTMLIALLTDILPVYSEHGRSMIVGTLAYIAMGGIVLSKPLNNKHIAIASGMMSVGFIAAHILIEAALFSTIGIAAVTSPFGYAAIAAFLLAGVAYLINRVKSLENISLYINGFMTAGVTLVYYHVASLAPVRASVLFFVPFTLFFAWTVGQYGLEVSQAFKTRRQTA